MIVRARYLWAANNQLLTNAALRIQDGLIAEIGSADQLTGGPAIDAGDSLLLPGFVNAHTHLELTHLAGLVPPSHDFTDWLGRLLASYGPSGDRSQQAGQSAQEGANLSLTHGVTTVGDISRYSLASRSALRQGPLRVISFGEVIGIGPGREKLAQALELAADGSLDSPFLQAGISPHSPYTLEPQGLQACANLAQQHELRLCMHLAETPQESDFTLNLTGPLRSHLQRLGAWDHQVKCPGLGPVAYAQAMGLLGPRMLLAHVNYADDDDLDLLAKSGVHVAYCPRTHAAFGHVPHRFAQMLARGINVCVGTDSLASNPSLSVLDELRFLHRQHPQISPAMLLEMGTLRAAKALGMSARVGTIEPGKVADLTVLPLDPDGSAHALRNILQSKANPSGTCVGGHWVKPIASS